MSKENPGNRERDDNFFERDNAANLLSHWEDAHRRDDEAAMRAAQNALKESHNAFTLHPNPPSKDSSER